MLLLVLHVLLFVKFLKSFHGKIKIIDYLLQWECPSLDQDLAEQNMKNYFIHQTSEDGHPVMSNKSASNFAMDEYLVSLQLKGKSELTHDETISNHVQQLSPAGAIVSWCYAATFSPFPLLSHSLHHRIPELCHSLSRPRALYVPWDQKGTDRLTAMNQSFIWSEPILSLSLWFCFRFWKVAWSWKSTKGKHLGWAKLVCIHSPVVVLMVLDRFVP